MNIFMAAALFIRKRRKLEEQKRYLKDTIVKCPKENKEVKLEICTKCKYSKKDNNFYKLRIICKYK